MLYIHILPPSKAFLKRIIGLFELTLPKSHVFCLFGDIPTDEFLDRNIGFKSDKQKDLVNFIKSQESIDGIIIHGLVVKIERIIKNIPEKVKVAWYMWGYEPFEAKWKLDNQLYFKDTRRIVIRHSPYYWYRMLNFRYRGTRPFRNLFDRFDFCVNNMIEEYNFLIDNKILTTKTKWMPGSVGYWEQVSETDSKIPTLGENILVGNSANFSNNHLEIFKMLSEINLGNKKIVVPLSYGNKRYRNAILKKGKWLLGDSFVPLTTFLPLEKFNEIINSCNTMIMNHKRQQALGNINLALWGGVKVYLNDTTTYRNYKRRGIKIHLLEKSHFKNIDLMTKRDSQKDILQNRNLILNELSKDITIEKTKAILKALKEK